MAKFTELARAAMREELFQGSRLRPTGFSWVRWVEILWNLAPDLSTTHEKPVEFAAELDALERELRTTGARADDLDDRNAWRQRLVSFVYRAQAARAERLERHEALELLLVQQGLAD